MPEEAREDDAQKTLSADFGAKTPVSYYENFELNVNFLTSEQSMGDEWLLWTN